MKIIGKELSFFGGGNAKKINGEVEFLGGSLELWGSGRIAVRSI